MRKTLLGLRHYGEPVYEEWSHDGTVLDFFSRETRRVKDGWKFVCWVPLYKLRVDGRLGKRRLLHQVELAREHLLTLPGVTTTA